LALQGGPPHVFQFFKRKDKGIPFGEHQQRMISGQLGTYLPRQLTEETLRTIPPHRYPKASADDNRDPTRPSLGPANQQVEEGS
jgi:hypothetical protein